MKRKRNRHLSFFYNAFYCCLMTYLYSTTGGFLFGAAALISFIGYSYETVQIYRHGKSQLLLEE